MNQRASNRYREVQVKTAAKDDLLMLLLDGGVRFSEGALLEMRRGKEEDREKRNDHLIRSQKILLELIGSLSPGIGLELYNSLQRLYEFTFRRFFEGNLRSDVAMVEEGVTMMKRIRELWQETVDKARQERSKPLQDDRPSSSSISFTG